MTGKQVQVFQISTVGSDEWRKKSLVNIQTAQALVKGSDRLVELSKRLDPLPSLRDLAAIKTNCHVHRYSRAVREVVVYLKKELYDLEEERKALVKTQLSIEGKLDCTRKDMALNKSSVDRRCLRPAQEQIPDYADSILDEERITLIGLKATLESHLRSVQKEICVFMNLRSRLLNAISERVRALNLDRDFDHKLYGCLQSADVKKEPSLEVDPLGPFSPECQEVLNLSGSARLRCATLRQEVKDALQKVSSLQASLHKSVNDALAQKISETVSLQQSLILTGGEMRIAANRTQRLLESTTISSETNLGPQSYNSLQCKERLDRPLVRVFQRHPGTQVPEAQEICHGSEELLAGRSGVHRDAADKRSAAQIDQEVYRLRRRKFDHRWTLGPPH